MKVTHMVGLTGGAEGTLRGTAPMPGDTQRSAASHNMAIVQFLIVAEEEDMG